MSPLRVSALNLSMGLPVHVSNAGLFISRGQGTHPDRVINSHELIFVREGILRIKEDDLPFEVQSGESLVLWPRRRHRGTATYPSDLSYFWIHFWVQEDRDAVREMLVVPQHVRISRPDHLTSLFRRFLDDQETIGVQPLPASLLVMLMLFEIASSSPAMSIAETTATALAGRANNLIRTRYHEPLSTALIARELHCNPDYLGRTFGRVYGRTLTEAIHQYRLKQARRLLLEDQGTVAQIAQACGFNDPGYFRRLFKRAEGVTPYAFRRLYAHLHVNTV